MGGTESMRGAGVFLVEVVEEAAMFTILPAGQIVILVLPKLTFCL
jgi:hypothetical protein